MQNNELTTFNSLLLCCRQYVLHGPQHPSELWALPTFKVSHALRNSCLPARTNTPVVTSYTAALSFAEKANSAPAKSVTYSGILQHDR